ncbi:beta,beta-carotene 15,15'-monooxygenase [Plakobranchus ocellatus]|uniref:Beta,beta-carotene 15,15'-monooxygenase n=1 Tax=Plakobranchus ocellatus TaxID=259542 RepID=A0AAV4DPX7_9GAST|nr:beta,beta-carotene 15,15'-monooxygenase [Plakobranchus ocellatus]
MPGTHSLLWEVLCSLGNEVGDHEDGDDVEGGGDDDENANDDHEDEGREDKDDDGDGVMMKGVVVMMLMEMMKVISGFQALPEAGAPMADLNSRQKGPCRSQDGLTSHCATDVPNRRLMTQEMYSKLPQWLNLEQSDHMEKPINTIVSGKIPTWICGSLYRNGPGIYKVGPTAWNHVFDGFAVLQRWTFKDGTVTFQSSILDSDCYKKSARHNKIVGQGLGNRFPDPCETIFSRLFHKFVPSNLASIDNTLVNIVEFGDRLFAVTESLLLNEVTPDSLKVMGKTQLSKQLALHLGTAHPHILKDGSMIYYGTHFDYCKAYNFVSVPAQPESSKPTFEGAKIVATVPSRWKMNISYTHSFGITENYFVHLEQPLTFNIPRLMMMGLRGACVEECMVIHQDETMDIHVIDRATGKRIPIAFKAPNGFVFHFINCYEDLNHIVFDACFYPNEADSMKKKYLDYLANNFTEFYTCDESVHFARFVMPLKLDEKVAEDANLVTLPYTTATAVIKRKEKNVVYLTPETIEGSPIVDLPRINYDYNGVKYRYFYGTSAFNQERKQLSKFDLEQKRVMTYDAEKNVTPGEPVFLARPGATKEDDGVVVSTLIADSPDAQSFLVVLDAETFEEVGRASLPHEVKMNFTFHGNFTDKIF